MLLSGYFIYKSNISASDALPISHMMIHPTDKVIPNNYILLLDDNNEVCIFTGNTIDKENNITIKQYYIIYTTGKTPQNYVLSPVISSNSTVIIIEDKKYILENKSNKRFYCVKYKDNNIFFFNRLSDTVEDNITKYILMDSYTNIKDLETLVSSIINSFTTFYKGSFQKVVFSFKDENIYYMTIFFKEEIHILVTKYYSDDLEEWMITLSKNKEIIKILLEIPKLSNNFVVEINNEYNKIILKYNNSNISLISYKCKFIVKLLSFILLEKRIIIFSKNNNNIFYLLIYILNVIEPFKYKNTIISRMNENVEMLIDSPFPYILCYNRNITSTDIISVDLDKEKIYTTIDDNILLFEESLEERYLSANDKINVLKNYCKMLQSVIDRRTEEKISLAIKNIKELKKLLYTVEEIMKDKEEFFREFSRTKMYKEYILREDIEEEKYYKIILDTKYNKNYFITKVNEYNIFLYYKEIKEYNFISVLKLYLYLYNGSLQNIIERLINKKDEIMDISGDIFKYYSERELLEEIIEYKRLLDNLKYKINNRMLLNIKYYRNKNNKTFFQGYDIKYKVKVTNNEFEVRDTSNNICLRSKILAPEVIIQLLNIYKNHTKEYLITYLPVVFWSILILFRQYELEYNDIKETEDIITFQ